MVVSFHMPKRKNLFNFFPDVPILAHSTQQMGLSYKRMTLSLTLVSHIGHHYRTPG